MTQNAIYYKVKRVIPFTATGTNILRLGINFNGKEIPSSDSDPSTAIWLQQGSGAAAAQSMGDLPDLSGQYDSNRLAAVKIKWFPSVPNGSQTAVYAPMTMTYDRDGIENNVIQATLENQLEQVNSVRTRNMYLPWQKYIKAPKYRINTRMISGTAQIPTEEPTAYQPNENMAGQWKRVNSALSGSDHATFSTSAMTTPIERGTHLLLTVSTPAGITPTVQNPFLIGTVVVTSYYVYKDRR